MLDVNGLKLGPGARPPSQLAALKFILVQCAQEMSVQSDVVELIRKCTFANEGSFLPCFLRLRGNNPF